MYKAQQFLECTYRILQCGRVIKNKTFVKVLTSPFIFAGSHMTVNNSPRVGQVDNGRRNQKTICVLVQSYHRTTIKMD